MSDQPTTQPPGSAAPPSPQANGTADLVSLDEATQTEGAGTSAGTNGESILNAAAMFQQQLEQMTAWKQQLAQQMDALRRDGAKLLERQKNLASDKQKLADERAQLTAQREEIQKAQGEFEEQSRRLAQRAGELETLQNQLSQVQSQREQAERELAARQKSLVEQEARHLAEDVRLKEGLEQLEAQRRQLAETQRQVTQEREALANQSRDLESRLQAFQQQNQSLAAREQTVEATRQQLEQAQSAVQGRQNELAQLQTSLQSRQDQVQAAEQQIAQERQNLQKQRQEMQRKLETLEREQAEQLEALAKQTKRLTERRAEVDASEADIEKLVTARLAQATESFKEELNRSTAVQRERIFQLEEQLRQSDAATKSLQARESQLQQELNSVNGQLAKLREELKSASASLERVSTERSSLAQQLSHQVEQARQEAAKWQQALESARAQAGNGQGLQDAQNESAAARKELNALKEQFAALQKAKEDLEFQIALKDEEQSKTLDAIKKDLRQAISQRDAQIQELRQKLETQQAAGGASDGKTQELIAKLQQERNDLATQLSKVKDQLRRLHEESVLSKNVMEGKLLSLEQKNAALEAQRGSGARPAAAPVDPQLALRAAKQADLHRQRLLKQAKALRGFRQQVKESQAAVSASRAELNEGREQLRARKENLEQVKRLLEKQEMVMARKLADHNAIKTVAAVGIFVIMVLGSVFFGVYRFVHPVYRSEAVVQLAPPADLPASGLDAWLNRQVDYMQTSEVTFAAWKILRGTDGHYVMHDVREEWLASLTKNYKLSLNPDTKTLNIRYSGPDADGVSQVCNALAEAYVTPALRDSIDQATRNLGSGAKLIAQATPSKYPSEDNRMMICLTGVASTLFVSLIFVMVFRHFIARQLKEIDQMADSQDLADVKSDLPETNLAV